MSIFTFIVGCFFICATPSKGQSGFITGRVFSAVNKATLYDAKLILKRNHKYHQKAKTDHVGNYWFGDLPYGTYSIWVLQDGYCQLEISQIVLSNNGSIQLDLGLIQAAETSNIKAPDKIYKIYQAPIHLDLDLEKTAYLDFKNEIHIIQEIYNGPEIRIAPRQRPPSPLQNNRATHYHESLKALEKITSFAP